MHQHLFWSVCIFVQQHVCALALHDQVPVQHVAVPLWQLDGDGNYFVEERTPIALMFAQVGALSNHIRLEFRPFESKALPTLVPATGQEHVSCGSRPFIPMDDAIWHLAKTREWIPGEVLATPEWLWFTIGFYEWWYSHTCLSLGWWSPIYREWWKHACFQLWHCHRWQPVQHLSTVHVQRSVSAFYQLWDFDGFCCPLLQKAAHIQVRLKHKTCLPDWCVHIWGCKHWFGYYVGFPGTGPLAASESSAGRSGKRRGNIRNLCVHRQRPADIDLRIYIYNLCLYIYIIFLYYYYIYIIYNNILWRS